MNVDHLKLSITYVEAEYFTVELYNGEELAGQCYNRTVVNKWECDNVTADRVRLTMTRSSTGYSVLLVFEIRVRGSEITTTPTKAPSTTAPVINIVTTPSYFNSGTTLTSPLKITLPWSCKAGLLFAGLNIYLSKFHDCTTRIVIHLAYHTIYRIVNTYIDQEDHHYHSRLYAITDFCYALDVYLC